MSLFIFLKGRVKVKAVVTVIGKDKMGIIAKVSTALYEKKVNIVDLTQTLVEEYFTMVMLVSLEKMDGQFGDLQKALDEVGKSLGLSIKVQHQDIFESMHNLAFGSVDNEEI